MIVSGVVNSPGHRVGICFSFRQKFRRCGIPAWPPASINPSSQPASEQATYLSEGIFEQAKGAITLRMTRTTFKSDVYLLFTYQESHVRWCVVAEQELFVLFSLLHNTHTENEAKEEKPKNENQ